VPEELESDEYGSEDDGGEDSGSNIVNIPMNEPQFYETFEDENNEDIENNEDETNDNEQLNQFEGLRLLVRRLIKRVRACVNNIRSTRAIIDYVKQKAKATDPPIKSTLVTDFVIRWNTTFIMTNRFINYRSIIDNINSQPLKIPHISTTQQTKIGSKRFEFINDDWCKLNDLQDVLKPFFVTTSIMSGKNYPSLAVGYSGELHILTLLRSYSTLWK
jgi:hypothetical protein